MKKLWAAFLLSVAVCCAFPAGAYAEGREFSLADGIVTFTAPDLFDYYITQDTPASDPAFAYFGFDYDSYHEDMVDCNIYLDAIAAERSADLIVTMSDSYFVSCNSFNDDSLNRVAEYALSSYSAQDIIVIESKICTINQNKYFFFKTKRNSADGSYTYGITYSTVQNSKTVSFVLWSYGVSPSKTEEDAMYALASSADFPNIPSEEDPIASDEYTFYTDDVTGVSFMLPSVWHEQDFPRADQDSFHFKTFVSKKGTAIIWFASYPFDTLRNNSLTDTDIKAVQKALKEHPVSEVFPKSILANYASCSENDVRVEEIGYKEFYVTNESYENTLYDSSLTDFPNAIYETWLTADEHFIYIFSYKGDPTSYNDFLGVLFSSSIVDNAAVPSSHLLHGADLLIISFFLGLVILVFPILLYKQIRYKGVKVPKAKSLLIVLICCTAVNTVVAILLSPRTASVGILWYAIDYAILRSGRETPAAEAYADGYSDYAAPENASYASASEPPAAPQGENAASAFTPAESPAETAAEAPHSPKFCYHCGFPLPKGCKFCPGCGTKL